MPLVFYNVIKFVKFAFFYLFDNDIIFPGAHDKKKDGEVYGVSKVEFNSEFNSWTLQHDVAVLKLSRPAKLGKKVGTICLPRQGSRARIGSKCFVTGKKTIVKPVLHPRGMLGNSQTRVTPSRNAGYLLS